MPCERVCLCVTVCLLITNLTCAVAPHAPPSPHRTRVLLGLHVLHEGTVSHAGPLLTPSHYVKTVAGLSHLQETSYVTVALKDEDRQTRFASAAAGGNELLRLQPYIYMQVSKCPRLL